MSSALPFVTPEVLAQALQELRAEQQKDRAFLAAFLRSQDDQVGTKKALEITGIRSRTTLLAKRQEPGTPLTYTVHGRTVAYSRAGCIAYKLGHQLAA